MKICFYSPYLPNHFGGGEKHFFDTARAAVALKNQVYIAISGTKISTTKMTEIKSKYQARFGFKDDELHFIQTPIGTKTGFWKKLFWTAQFNAIYYVTDGSLFFSLARRNLLHIQIPFTSVKRGFVNRMKLTNWSNRNANSFFTKNIVEQAWKIKIQHVLHPGIKTGDFAAGKVKKEKYILNVGRFFSHLHSKKQEVMVNFFKDLCDKYPELMMGWQLVLIGPVEDENYAKKVANAAKGYPIKIIHQADNKEVISWYKKSAIYWHATGYGESELIHPERMEHFGITTLEAMASGGVPVVIKKGGQPEILGRKLQDCLWETPSELEKKTLALIKNEKLREICRIAAVTRARGFSMKNFGKKVAEILKQ